MGRTDVDHRSDLWSFGVILFQVLTGMKPFPGGNLFEALVRICSDPVPRPSSIAPDLPAGTDAFFERALERDVGKRFQSARELERAFYALVARPSASVPPEPMGEPGHAAGAALHEDANASEVHGLTVPPPRQKPLLLIGAGVGLVLLAAVVIVWKSSGTSSATTVAPTPVTVASAAAPSEPASAAVEPPAAPSSASAGASASPSTAPEPAPAAAHAASAPHVGAAAAPRPAPAPAPAHKPKRDLGY
jgi:serine/threonine-protein kinase